MAVIVLTFQEPVPPPPLGYIVKYKEVGAPTWNIVTPNPMASPIQINVPPNKLWMGTIEAQMDTNTVCSPVEWRVNQTLQAAWSKIEAKVAATEGAVCAANNVSIYSATNMPNGVPVTDAEIFFDFDGLVPVGDGYIVGSDGIIYQVTNSIIGLPTGNNC